MELYNQVSHCFLGVLLASAAGSCFYLLYDEYPDKVLLLLFCVSIYFIVIELLAQKWSGLDSLIDLIFVAFGVLSLTYGLDEVIIQGKAFLQPHFAALAVVIVSFSVSLLAHILKRLYNERSS